MNEKQKKKFLEKNIRVKRTEKSFVHNFRAIFIDKLFSIVDFDNYELISRTQSSCQHDLYMMYFHTYIHTTNNISTHDILAIQPIVKILAMYYHVIWLCSCFNFIKVYLFSLFHCMGKKNLCEKCVRLPLLNRKWIAWYEIELDRIWATARATEKTETKEKIEKREKWNILNE